MDLDCDDDVGGFEGDDDCVMMLLGEVGGVEGDVLDVSNAGLISRALKRLFERCELVRNVVIEVGGVCEIEVKCLYLEIYNEML